MTAIAEMFSYPFMLRALIVGVIVSVCAAMLGTSLVLRRYSMIGDGLSHVGFAALAIAYAMNLAPLSVAIPVCMAAAFILLRLKESSHIKGDAATALMCSGALAAGVMTISLTTGMNTDVCNYMFGSILAVSRTDMIFSTAMGITIVILYIFFYNRIFAMTFDDSFAKATGMHSDLCNIIMAMMTAVTVVLGMRMMGTLLISSLIVFPSLTAMRLCRNFKSVIICSAVTAVICFVLGLVISYTAATPTGASIVMCDIVCFLLFSALSNIKCKKKLSELIVTVIIMVSLPVFIAGCGKNERHDAVIYKGSDVSENMASEGNVAEDEKLLAVLAAAAESENAVSAADTGKTASDNTSNTVSGNSMTAELPSEFTGKNIRKNGGTAYYDCQYENDREYIKKNGIDITVGDNLYMTQINDWYTNFSDYDGRSVEIEGYYLDMDPYLFVGRKGPTCPYCTGGYVDFEFLPQNDLPSCVSEETWIKVTGVLRRGYDTEIKNYFYYIEAVDVKIEEKTGKDTVTQ